MKFIIAALLSCACGGAVSPPDPVPDAARAADVLVQDEPDADPPLNMCNYNGVALACTGPGFNVRTDAGTFTCFDRPCNAGDTCAPIGAASGGTCE